MAEYLSATLRDFCQQEWLKEMRAHCKNGHFELLPSEVARIVAERWSVDPATILLAFAPEKGTGDAPSR